MKNACFILFAKKYICTAKIMKAFYYLSLCIHIHIKFLTFLLTILLLLLSGVSSIIKWILAYTPNLCPGDLCIVS